MTMVEPPDPNTTFAFFTALHGAEKLARCYTTELKHLPGERHWDFYEEDDVLIGWGCILRKSGSVWSYRAGVLPQHERHGYRKRIRYLLALQAFRDPSCQSLRTSVRLENPHQVDSMLHDAISGRWAAYAGLELDPPRLVFKLSREQFETSIMRPEDKG